MIHAGRPRGRLVFATFFCTTSLFSRESLRIGNVGLVSRGDERFLVKRSIRER